jgi:hypothetical protein
VPFLILESIKSKSPPVSSAAASCVHKIPLYHVDISKDGDRLKAFGAIDRLFMFFLWVSQAHFSRAVLECV